MYIVYYYGPSVVVTHSLVPRVLHCLLACLYAYMITACLISSVVKLIIRLLFIFTKVACGNVIDKGQNYEDSRR